MAKPAPSQPRPRNAAQSVAAFRSAIAKAIEDGVDADAMTLRLTLGDAANLRKDRSIPIEDISFRDGEMRLLGVKVVTGGVRDSSLDLTEG
ncbi:MAG TPA: hypothetical protein VFW47_00765 [Phenylobacterium sp.]|nr:hypothetical protein [Phenylobacterium sp.]